MSPPTSPSFNGDFISQPLNVAGKAAIGVFMPEPDDVVRAIRSEVNELDYSILAYTSLAKFLARFNDEPPTLILIDLDQSGDDLHAVMECARDNWPFAEVLGLSAAPEAASTTSKLDGYGRIQVLSTLENEHLAEKVAEALRRSSYGLVRGITLPSLLQILDWEKRTLDVKVEQGWINGRLHFIDGVLVDASVADSSVPATKAATQLLSLDKPRLWLKRSYHDQSRTITVSLQSLLMEAAVATDQAGREAEPGGTSGEENAQYSPTQPFKAQPGRGIADVLEAALSIDGAMGSALVEYGSGMALGTAGHGLDLNVASAGNTEVVRAKKRTMDALGISDSIEDILITLDTQYHIIYLLPKTTLFLYLVLRKEAANLALARYKLRALAQTLTL